MKRRPRPTLQLSSVSRFVHLLLRPGALLLATTVLAACTSGGEEEVVVGQTQQRATFPAESRWVAVPQAGGGIGDIGNDGGGGEREVVGDATNAAVYTYTDGIDFFVRIRLDGSPAQSDSVRPFGWGLLIDTDGNFSAYEYALMVDGTGNPRRVLFARNTSPGTVGDPNDVAETIINAAAINTAAGGNVRISLANTSFNGTPDYFLDFASPLSGLTQNGLGLNAPLRFIAGTSNNGNSLSLDVAGTSARPGPGVLQQASSDPIYMDGSKGDIDGDGVLNPTDRDDDNDGILDARENLLRLDPDADRDTDGIPNWRDANDQGNGTRSTCVDAASDGLCDAPSELYDTDRDGVPNHLDLDSDNDGIPDVHEAGHRAANTNGMVTGTLGANGFLDSLETTPESGTPSYVRLDTDNDNVPDFIDLDSDADGSFDLHEIGRASLDANNDGRVDSTTDADKDGIPAPVDANETLFGRPLVNVLASDNDADGIPNPYDAASAGPGSGDSDGDGLTDAAECVGGWPCPDTNQDGTPNYMVGADTDGDGVANEEDAAPTNPLVCRDTDGDGCDDCSVTGADGSGGSVANDGPDFDNDGRCDAGDLDDDNDGVPDTGDAAAQNPLVCRDADADTCDDCSVTGANGSGGSVTNDGPDADADGRCDAGDLDDDNDGVPDLSDAAPTNPAICRDVDGDGCNDCWRTGADGSGGNPADDGADLDEDGLCDAGDPDDDDDDVPDEVDTNPRDAAFCRDSDNDTCDDCSFSPTGGGNPANDGTDVDGDGLCDAGDPDDDDDGVPDTSDAAPTNPAVCRDTDADGCDDCSVTRGNRSGGNPADDGADADGDGLCDAGDPDDDDDGVPDGEDTEPQVPSACRDADQDGCDDCAISSTPGGDPSNDGTDSDADGLCDVGDPDDDDDGVPDASDLAPGNPLVCRDLDGDGCDDCSLTGDDLSGGDPNNDGPDLDANGLCDAGEDSDGDGVSIPADLDADNDGIPNARENTIGIDPLADRDDDGIANFADPDDRGDGAPAECADVDEDGRCDRLDGLFDTDGDGTPNHLDLDSDGDGIADLDEAGHTAEDADRDGRVEGSVGANGLLDVLETATESGAANYTLSDVDGDGIPDFLDVDSDGDRIADAEEAGDELPGTPPVDTDEDATPDYRDDDSDGDRILDRDEAGDDRLDTPAVDTDGDATPDYRDDDSDDDGLSDADEAGDEDPSTPPIDSDEDTLPNFQDPDSDDDNVLDGADNCVLVPNSNQQDSDGNGVGDACEGDQDGDGVLDPVDNCPSVSNPEQQDSDDNGVGDACDVLDTDDDGVPDDADNCPETANPGQEDADEDGVGDACEAPPAADADQDGVPDASDNCPAVANPDQADSDDDGVGNACEPRDADGDGVPDAEDNCDQVPNGDQQDSDGDGTGDACEPPLPDDRDNDGVPDVTDNCPTTPNPNQLDTDEDGLGDACEEPASASDADGDGATDEEDNCPSVANTSQADRDRDGQGDACDRDANGDGFDDELGTKGGGCAVAAPGGGSGHAGAWALLALGAALVTGARRRGQRRLSRAALVTCSVAGVLSTQLAEAQTQIPVERFRLATTREGILDVESGQVRDQLAFDAALWVGYANDPLTVYRTVDGERERVGSLVAHRWGGALVGTLVLVDRLQLGVTVPLVLAQQDSRGSGMPDQSLQSFGLGNVELAPKLQFVKQEWIGIDAALQVGVQLPTTTSDDYFGDEKTVVTPELAVSRNFGGGVHAAVNLGYRLRGRTQLLDLTVNDELLARLGVSYRFKDVQGPPLELSLTASTSTAAGDPFSRFNRDHAELLGGIAYDVVPAAGAVGPVCVFGAGGVGLAEGFGTPDVRALIGVRLSGGRAEPEAPKPPPPAPSDRDLDGILDPVDACPDEAENKNGVADDDGCPDTLPDSDGDGLNDSEDRCPQEPEDRDTFQDEDGCPDPDNDGDQILDAQDRCPMEVGVAAMAGCPDPDRDQDTVVDRLDNCPDEPGSPELHGCKEKQLVRIAETGIEILEIVQFDYNKATIQKRSFGLLDNVARVIQAHPEIKRIRVEGHTDDRGDDAYNKKLSQERAESVVQYLVGKGVAADRLEAVGYGEERPVADNATNEGRTQNRRVEFKIVPSEGAAP